MAIWFKKDLQIADFAHWSDDTLAAHLGIVFTALGDDYLEATMPVDNRTHQPYGLLHGGASAALAETLGSVGSALVVDHSAYYTLGIEINANHIKAARNGLVTGRATPVHLGKTLHVWNIHIHDAAQQLICVSRLTVIIKKR
ncbi:MAG TPA: hotdog fold thioesterase [Chitinophagales bacterium]|nr:hotdog fold thioesterase [Chitinophagales bacterium]